MLDPDPPPRDFRTNPMTDREALDLPRDIATRRQWQPPEQWKMDKPPEPNWQWDFFGDGKSWIIRAYMPNLTWWKRASAWWWFGSKFTRLR